MRPIVLAITLSLAGGAVYAAEPMYNNPYGAIPRPVRAAPVASYTQQATPVAYLPPRLWEGAYIGAHVGHGGGDGRYAVAPSGGAPFGSLTAHSTGFAGGAQVGYNHMIGDGGVLGLEADISGSTISDSLTGVYGSLTANAGTRVAYLGSFRGRAGYALGSALVYGTAGFAYGGTTSSANVSGLGSGSVSTMHMGYVFGGGLEYAVAENITIRSEYLRSVLDARQLVSVPVSGVDYSVTHRPTINVIRAGVNFRFPSLTDRAPVVARY